MTEDKQSTKALRTKNNVIDQRKQQIDPAGHHRVDPNEAARQSQKQPGRRKNAQGEHAGSAHAPEAFDSKNPEKQGVGVKKQGAKRKKPAQDG